MAIIQSCCLWNSVREGSFATALYTLIYFGFSTIVFIIYANDEQDFLTGKRERPIGESIFEKGDITPTIVIFNMLFLCCSTLLIIASVLLIIGLYSDKRIYLLPWIVLMLCDVLIEIVHLMYLAFYSERVIFEPVVGFMFTIDFFIMCLNCYCLVCVISQYQEYKAGRGCRPILIGANSLRVESANATEETPSCLKTFPCNNQSTPSPFVTHQRKQYHQQQQHQQNEQQQSEHKPQQPQQQHQEQVEQRHEENGEQQHRHLNEDQQQQEKPEQQFQHQKQEANTMCT